MKLSKHSERLLEDFDLAAKNWGWTQTQDQGWGEMITRDQKAYNESLDALKKRLLHLEKLVKKSKSKSGV